MLNESLAAPVRLPSAALSTYAVPAVFTDRFENVATPLTAFTVVVPPSVAPAVPPDSDSVTAELSVVTTLPLASSTLTCALNAAPTFELAGGCVVKASLVATGVGGVFVEHSDTSLNTGEFAVFEVANAARYFT